MLFKDCCTLISWVWFPSVKGQYRLTQSIGLGYFSVCCMHEWSKMLAVPSSYHDNTLAQVTGSCQTFLNRAMRGRKLFRKINDIAMCRAGWEGEMRGRAPSSEGGDYMQVQWWGTSNVGPEKEMERTKDLVQRESHTMPYSQHIIHDQRENCKS